MNMAQEYINQVMFLVLAGVVGLFLVALAVMWWAVRERRKAWEEHERTRWDAERWGKLANPVPMPQVGKGMPPPPAPPPARRMP